ncbi:MAG: YceI family protein [Bacteroidia bacterium]
MKKATSIVLSLAIATSALATKPAVYKINAAKSTLTWLGKKVTGQHSGTVKLTSGTFNMQGKNITTGTFVIDMNSMLCTDLKAEEGADKLIGHLKSPDFFDTEKNKTATFVITQTVLRKDGQTDVTGKLTIKGITNEVTFPASVKNEGKALAMVGKITVDRTKFDIKYGSKSFFDSIGDKAIDNDFFIDFKIVALK